MSSRLKELARSVGQGWFVVLIGFALGVYGAVELVAHAKTTGWVWVVVGLVVLMGVTLNVAYQALKARDTALAQLQESGESTAPRPIFQGGEHQHYYGALPQTDEGETSVKADQSDAGDR